ncbi:amidohydrolase [Arcobacter nitrofigilis DSM 7299]|uniref:Amidohydrolase n=1 Tax=Arcobacter nitrofigilis (strain ATCC 33309 / DSM 7299 / CCUG 15893 / LMG 7604 / NCTC 12251 / CI) TaxID=572480 RepID=D5V2I4_ARCNC|nr:metal-dependent hydrolase [Arcobacter nitrofigilis]ADG92417.1 amidohydrolase [Arcobacter nitrofigilis DSM 7299]
MKILKASWLICVDENSTIIKDGAILFDEKIKDFGEIESLKAKYKDLEVEDLGVNTVLMPGLINSHIHLEFSSNSTSLSYGNFMSWLNSVIINREALIEKSSTTLINTKLNEMLKGGTTTIGAISSYGFEIEACTKTPINTVLFSEVIGSKADMIDTLFTDFKARLESAKKSASKSFIPAIAIHSPYSVHPFLVRESLRLAKEENLNVSAHFLESIEEFDWLHKDEGKFLEFFKNFLGQEKSATKPMEFLQQFSGIKNLSFTHCVEASDNDLEKIKELGAVINHCPTSNRVLNNKRLEIEKLKDITYAIGTDGLSSNNSLQMFDELRNALMIHTNLNINELSVDLIKAATLNGAKALGLNKGRIKQGCDADIIVCKLPDEVKNEEELCTQIILHTKEVQNVYINGEKHV